VEAGLWTKRVRRENEKGELRLGGATFSSLDAARVSVKEKSGGKKRWGGKCEGRATTEEPDWDVNRQEKIFEPERKGVGTPVPRGPTGVKKKTDVRLLAGKTKSPVKAGQTYRGFRKKKPANPEPKHSLKNQDVRGGFGGGGGGGAIQKGGKKK